jgi:hypothetical protein
MENTRRQTPTEARKAALDSDYAALYAVAGLTDSLAEVLKGALVETQGRAGHSFSRLQRQGTGVRQQAQENADDLRTFVITLPEQVKNLPNATRLRIAELQRQANGLLAQASSTYGALAGRGKRAVDDAMGTAWDLSGRAERRLEETLTEAANRVDPAFETMQETVTQARKTVTGRTATPTMTPRTAAKGSATRKATATRAPATKGAAAKKAAAPRNATARKTPAKKAAS